MANSKKAAPKKRGYWKGKRASNADTFEIDVSPPVPARTQHLQTLEMYAKVDRTLSRLKIGQAFIIPLRKRVPIRRYLNLAHSEGRFSIVRIIGSVDFARVYRLPPK